MKERNCRAKVLAQLLYSPEPLQVHLLVRQTYWVVSICRAFFCLIYQINRKKRFNGYQILIPICNIKKKYPLFFLLCFSEGFIQDICIHRLSLGMLIQAIKVNCPMFFLQSTRLSHLRHHSYYQSHPWLLKISTSHFHQ